MKKDNYTFEDLTAVLPDHWREKAKELGALQRAREIKTPEDLLKLIFLYLTEGKSFGNTSALLNMSERRRLTKKAIYTRLCHSVEWLKWLCENLCRENHVLTEKPAWLGQKRVYLADAGGKPDGSSKTAYRLYYCIGLFDLAIKELRLTDTKTEENLSNFQTFTKDDLIIAGRSYGTVAGIEYLAGCGSDFLLRYRSGAFNLYTEARERTEAADFFRDLEPGSYGDITLYYKLKEEYRPVRLCAVRKTEEAADQKSAAKDIERLSAMNRMKSQEKPPGEVQLPDDRYIMLITSLFETDAELILQLYRFRQQIEPVFKRFKSLFGYNQIPAKVEASAKAQVYGKLLLAAFCEIRSHDAPRPER
jgi:hypothetical protein